MAHKEEEDRVARRIARRLQVAEYRGLLPRRQNFGLPALRHAPVLPASKVIVKLQYNRISIAHTAWPAPAQILAFARLVRKLMKAYELDNYARTEKWVIRMAVGCVDGRVRLGTTDGEFGASSVYFSKYIEWVHPDLRRLIQKSNSIEWSITRSGLKKTTSHNRRECTFSREDDSQVVCSPGTNCGHFEDFVAQSSQTPPVSDRSSSRLGG